MAFIRLAMTRTPEGLMRSSIKTRQFIEKHEAWAAADLAAAEPSDSGYTVWRAAWDATANMDGYTVGALAIRDRISETGFTQEHYDTLTNSWRRTVGQLHPDDVELPLFPHLL